MDDFEKSVGFKHDDGRLDALIQAKLNPSVLPTNLHSQELTTNEIEPILSNTSTLRSTQPTTELSNTNTLRSTQPTTELPNTDTLRSTQPTSELLNTDTLRSTQPTSGSSNTDILRSTQPASGSSNTDILRSTQPTSGSSNTNTLRLTQPPTASPSVDVLRAALSRIPLPSTESLRSTQPRIETTDTETVRSTQPRTETTNTETVRSTQPRTETTNTETLRSTQPTVETTYTETPKSTQPAPELTNTTSPNDNVTESTTNDEFDAGHTQHIQRANPILISTINDKFAGTVCCHNNQLLYNDFDRTTQSSHLIFIRDITNPTTKQSITWEEPDSSLNASDDEWIQDIIYSDKISGYLILNRARLRVLKPNCHDLDEFQQFPDRIMKRLTCNDKYIYLTSTRSGAGNTGDEIILMNYDKEEQLCKTFRDIIPSRLNRGAGPLVGEISDIAAGSNNQVTIGYRLERRHEVGVCVFNVLNDGKEWSCIKQLLLNECWHSDLSYTPRIDWCEKLNLFLLIEYMTGHLIMIDKDGQVEGECRFMHVENRRESPINLTISTNDWLCVRYESSISIHRVNS
jgi:hypothetical protein